jgi:tripartite-type tricarboxylate transporter receptor subunit TctC
VSDTEPFCKPTSELPITRARSGRRVLLIALLAAVTSPLLVKPIEAGAQNSASNYPNKPIRIVAPWPPGGANDILAREIAMRLGTATKQSVFVENRGGSNGSIGAEAVARAAPDGYTVMVHSVTSHATNPAIYPKLNYDTERDFQVVTLITAIPQIIVVNPAFPVKTLDEMVAMAKAQPGKISYASYGNGSPGHLAGELFKATTKTDMVHVPYKGGGPALIDTMAGHVPVYFASIATVMQQVKAGKLRALAVTSAKRSLLLPDVPTVDEALGIKGYELSATYGVFVPAKTPPEIVASLHDRVVTILRTPDFQRRLESEGADGTLPTTPEQGTAFLKAEVIKFARIVRESGAKGD